MRQKRSSSNHYSDAQKKSTNVDSDRVARSYRVNLNEAPKKSWWRRGSLLSLEQKDGIKNKTKRLNSFSKALIVIAVIFTAFFGYKLFAATFAVIDRSGKPDALALRDNISPDELKREGDGRINILLIGIGGKGHEAGDLSDVNQVLSIDPFNKKAAVLAIPRDFYVPIPGYYSTRINSAHAFGEINGGKGPELAIETIEQTIGIPIHYYTRVDFTGFKEAIDAVGGVEVTIKDDLYDPSFPTEDMRGTQVFKMNAGTYHLNGTKALQVVRCRKGTCGDDFGRADRQQRVLTSLQKKALSLGTASNPAKVSAILDSIGGHVRTDMSLSTMVRLAEIGKQFQDKKIKPKSFVLSTEPEHFLTGTSVGGASVLIPSAGLDNFSEIQNYVRGTLFRDGFLEKEKATITVLNGTFGAGLAETTGNMLSSYGYEVKTTGDYSNKPVAKTKLYKVTDKKSPFTSALLQKRLKKQISKGNLPKGLEIKSDYVLILGEDYAAQ